MARPLRILLDARMMLGAFSGVPRFVTSLVDELAPRDDLELLLLCGNEVPDCWQNRDDLEIITTDFTRRDRTAVRRAWWEETRLPKLLRRLAPDVYHATWNTGVPPRLPVPAVLTIHDLIPWHHPAQHFATLGQRLAYRFAIHRSARRATYITTVSEHVRSDVLRYLGVSAARLFAIPNGVDWPADSPSPAGNADTDLDVDTDVDTAEGAPTPYVLYVGGFEPRKNVAGVFHAVERYRSQYDGQLELRLTGAPEKLNGEAAEAYASMTAPSAIRWLGRLDEEQLAYAYTEATALLFLSYDEGFGLPALEAMAHGCPVIISTCPALKEVAGEAALIVGPDNPHQAATAIHCVRADHTLRQTMIEQGLARARTFTWRRTADAFHQLYRRAHQREQSASARKSRSQAALL
jgi:glycosyltransferase involved in cell wall biosynthesis